MFSGKSFGAVLAASYGMYYLATWQEWHFIDFVTLIMHEAGHPLFLIFGQTFSVLGGMLMQLLVPAAFVVYFFRSGQTFSSALALYWVGFSLVNAGIYIADAQTQTLSLIGGEHDWALLCSQWGILDRCSSLGRFVVSLGQATVLSACLWSWYTLRKERQELGGR
ncbi:MAG: hypothetical protein KBB51_01850 [Candidatus Moranbacteria bacterium]|nr:hypothetical protein [Candidatus Moranbacteria bacterium]